MSGSATIDRASDATARAIPRTLRRAPAWWAAAAAVARREWMGIIFSPVAWVALAAFAIPPGLAFAGAALAPGAPVSMRGPLIVAAWSLFAVAPVLAWRSIGEERRTGTWDLLLSSPASSSAIVLGKLAGQCAFLVVLSLPLAAQWAILAGIARPDPGEFLCGVAGVLLAGAVVLASALWVAIVAPGPAAAYLVTIGLWSAWILLGRALPTVVPPDWTAAAHAVDPLQRIDDFLLGIVDSADLAFFAAAGLFFLIGAIDSSAALVRPRRAGSGAARVALISGAAVAALLAVAVASQSPVRRSADLTRTRAWTLGDATRAIVASLEGDWRIEAIAGPDTVDALALRQLDEVLARFDGLATRGGRLRAARIDPADPMQAAVFEEALERLVRTYAGPLAQQRSALEEGLAAFERLGRWAAAEANALTALLAALPAEREVRSGGAEAAALPDPDRAALEQWRSTCMRLASDHRAFIEERRAQAASSERAPLGDAAGAVVLLDSALKAWIDQCAGVEEALRAMRRRDRLPSAVVEYLRDAPRRTLDMAQQLVTAQDRLARLPELAIAEVAAALRSGDAVIVSGPDRAGAIPGWQLLPPASRTDGVPSRGVIDRRFRGEEVIASSLRALQRGVAPEVIFVHNEGRSMLRASPDRAEFAALTDALRSARCAVREWQPSREPRPIGREARRTVWVVVPPLRRGSVEADPGEKRLLDAAARLIESGEPVLLTVSPSMLPLIGQSDPWAELARRLGVEARSGTTVLELVATSERDREVRAYFELEGVPSHPASSGASAMSVLITEPIPILPSAGFGASFSPLLAIAPARNRWLEDDWRSAARRTSRVPESRRFDEPVVVLAAVESPQGRRAVISGGAAWLLSGLADMTGQIGADRVFLRYPGNRELFVGCVGWLAGLHDGLGGASGREVERVPALEPRLRWTLAGSGAAGVPTASIALAAFISWRRRRP